MMDNKPVITCYGDANLYKDIQGEICQRLPREPVEWKRSYGRACKSVFIDATFVTFNENNLPSEKSRTLLSDPFLHLYFTDCTDADNYRQTVKDQIGLWMKILKDRNIHDWLIVQVISSNDLRKTKILPRSSIVDKMKSDFCNKQPERCITLVEPLKEQSKMSESWQGFIQRLRNLLVSSFNRNIGRFEENMRAQREMRTEPGWDFIDYFFLQEELAFVFEMLLQHEDALVQYDELDALLTQYLNTSNINDISLWLSPFNNPQNTWDGVSLSKKDITEKRRYIMNREASLLDLRNYLIGCQCSLLFFLQRPWEAAVRSLPFMHNCVNEIHTLDVDIPDGAIACWVFLSALEVLRLCERYNDMSQVENYSLYSSDLWNYARTKLRELGFLCGLMPDTTPTSKQLHLVVGLLSGMRERQEDGGGSTNLKLREALSSQDSFNRHYLELCELTLGTYKHIGRLRAARLVGRDLADYYMSGEFGKAESFLQDLLKMYVDEGWPLLAADIRCQISHCQKQLNHTQRCVHTCALLASDGLLNLTKQCLYFDEFVTSAACLSQDDPLTISGHPMMNVDNIRVACYHGNQVTVNENIVVELSLNNNLPQTITVATIQLSVYKLQGCHDNDGVVGHLASDALPGAVLGANPGAVESSMLRTGQLIGIQSTVELSKDDVIYSALVCPNSATLLQRIDSTNSLRSNTSPVDKGDFSRCCSANDITLEPGRNDVTLKCLADSPGRYITGQLCVVYSTGLQFIFTDQLHRNCFSVVDKPANITVHSAGRLLCGIPQSIDVSVFTGPYSTTPATDTVCISSTTGLSVTEGVYNIPQLPPYTTHTLTLSVLADINSLPHVDVWDQPMSQHQISCVWHRLDNVKHSTLDFHSPIAVKHNFHSLIHQNFIEVHLFVSCDTGCRVYDVSLDHGDCEDTEVELSPIQPSNSLDILAGEKCTLGWCVSSVVKLSSCVLTLSAEFTPSSVLQRGLQFTFNTNHKQSNRFIISSTVKPVDGAEFCEIGKLCSYSVEIVDKQREREGPTQRLFYNIRTDSNTWAVLGKNSGYVSSTEPSGEPVTYSLTLELMPLACGYIRFPDIELLESSSQTPENHTATQTTVYHTNRATQIRVMPSDSYSMVKVITS